MKTTHAIGLVVASVSITIAIQEIRIASLRSEAGKSGQPPATAAAKPVTAAATEHNAEPAPPVRTKSRLEAKPVDAAKSAAATDDESLAKTARKMWDNPAGKSMMNKGLKMAVAMMYEDFIGNLDLNKEESDYFKTLLGKEMADQQELGMKMLGASPEERQALGEELAKRAKETEEEIKKFLNNEGDFKEYTDYKNHLPERQQLDGIRAAMSGKGVPIDAETESRLIDAMYRARTESKTPDFSGPKGIEEMMKGNMVEAFEKSWDAQQETLKAETGKILNETQIAAFQEYQQQAKEMQLMGIKMAEKMMPGKEAEPP